MRSLRVLRLLDCLYLQDVTLLQAYFNALFCIAVTVSSMLLIPLALEKIHCSKIMFNWIQRNKII